MTLYLLGDCGVFGAQECALPAALTVLPAAAEVTLDGRTLTPIGKHWHIPPLSAGMHTLTADGRVIRFRVREGILCAPPLDPCCLLPTLARLLYLEKRVAALEQNAASNEVNWLK